MFSGSVLPTTDSFLLLLLDLASSSVATVLASWMDERDSPARLEAFKLECFLLPGILRYFFDLNTPESAGSAAAHQKYSPKEDIIWE